MTGHDDIILHHFDASPFAEKVRLALGIKQLSWYEVEIPMVMPKPMLTALTGGYRKTPVMQIGADIYCDTQRIARELEQRFPSPSLFPSHSQPLALALSHWSDSAFFRPGAALSMGTNADLPEDILRDREAFFTFLDFDTMAARLPHFFSQYQLQLRLVDEQLNDGRQYLLGDQPAWVDVLAYFPLWMGRGNIAVIEELCASLSHLLAWEKRMAAVGHGTSQSLAGEQALATATESTSSAVPALAEGAWPRDLELGASVTVVPEDYGVEPVQGQLLRLTHEDIALTRRTEDHGDLVVHFPRAGYEVIPSA